MLMWGCESRRRSRGCLWGLLMLAGGCGRMGLGGWRGFGWGFGWMFMGGICGWLGCMYK